MKRDNVFRIWIKGLALAVFGNVLGGIMTVSIAPFLGEWFVPYIALLLTVFIYASLVFTAGMRDGQKEAKMLRNKRVESVPKYRWIIMGLIIAAVMCIPCAALLACSLGAFQMTGEVLLGSYFVLGALAPSFFIVDPQALSPVFPLVLMAVYLIVTPIAAHLGYRFGTDEKSAKDFMYEK